MFGQIQGSANQRTTFAREVHYASCKIELYIDPRFNSVLVGRSHIGQMIGHE
jgi:hypothetical protein